MYAVALNWKIFLTNAQLSFCCVHLYSNFHFHFQFRVFFPSKSLHSALVNFVPREIKAAAKIINHSFKLAFSNNKGNERECFTFFRTPDNNDAKIYQTNKFIKLYRWFHHYTPLPPAQNLFSTLLSLSFINVLLLLFRRFILISREYFISV